MKTIKGHTADPYNANLTELDSFSDEFLLLLAGAGNIEAFGIIVERYENSLMNYVFYSILDYRKSQGIVRETFIRLLQKRRTKKIKFIVNIMLFSIARNLVREHIIWFQREFFSRNSRNNVPKKNLSNYTVIKAIRFLDIPLREVIILRDILGTSFDEIAAITRSSVKKIKSRISKARKELLDCVNNTFTEVSNSSDYLNTFEAMKLKDSVHTVAVSLKMDCDILTR